MFLIHSINRLIIIELRGAYVAPLLHNCLCKLKLISSTDHSTRIGHHISELSCTFKVMLLQNIKKFVLLEHPVYLGMILL